MRRSSPCAGSQCDVWDLPYYSWCLLYKNRGYKRAYTQLKQFFLHLKKKFLTSFTDLTPLLVGPRSESCSVGHWRGNMAPQLECQTAAIGTCAPLPSSLLCLWVTLGTFLSSLYPPSIRRDADDKPCLLCFILFWSHWPAGRTTASRSHQQDRELTGSLSWERGSCLRMQSQADLGLAAGLCEMPLQNVLFKTFWKKNMPDHFYLTEETEKKEKKKKALWLSAASRKRVLTPLPPPPPLQRMVSESQWPSQLLQDYPLQEASVRALALVSPPLTLPDTLLDETGLFLSASSYKLATVGAIASAAPAIWNRLSTLLILASASFQFWDETIFSSLVYDSSFLSSLAIMYYLS